MKIHTVSFLIPMLVSLAGASVIVGAHAQDPAASDVQSSSPAPGLASAAASPSTFTPMAPASCCAAGGWHR